MRRAGEGIKTHSSVKLDDDVEFTISTAKVKHNHSIITELANTLQTLRSDSFPQLFEVFRVEKPRSVNF
jgi:lipopolysaccharide/colanic/teichoic acid biosynthesis glycosyltransferase